MASILFTVGSLERWTDLFQVALWLSETGVDLDALYTGLRPPRRALGPLAEHEGLALPNLRWTRRVPAEALCVGTTDDLDELERLSPGRWAAVPRAPVPALLFPRPGPERLADAIAESRESPTGRRLRSDHAAGVPELAARVRGLPFVGTGLPEAREPLHGADPESIGIAHAWSLGGDRPRDRDTLRRETAELATLLAPLRRAKLRVEIQAADETLDDDGGRTLSRMLEWIDEEQHAVSEAVVVRGHEGWRSLSRARAVLVMTPEHLLRALAAGIENVYWLPFALPERAAAGRASPVLEAARIGDEFSYARWVSRRDWDKGPETSAGLARDLSSENGRRAASRIAQALVAAAGA